MMRWPFSHKSKINAKVFQIGFQVNPENYMLHMHVKLKKEFSFLIRLIDYCFEILKVIFL
jgi:hypothetical protein